MTYAVEMLKVTKQFGDFKANDEITLQVKNNEIHALLGENGAGKSTLMNLLFGFYELDGGMIKLFGKETKITDPKKATELGIGMVHQHFKLVHPFTVTENIILGSEPTKSGRVDLSFANDKVQKIINDYNFNINATDKVSTLTVGQQQKVEILKMLYKDAQVLIFDEPTGALTPQETIELLDIINELKAQGKTIILITHKLKEIKAVAEKCTIIRRGKSIDTVDVETTSEEQFAELMVGRKVNFKVDKKDIKSTTGGLRLENINMFDQKGSQTVKDVSFEVRKGEILGLAGVDGNGQIDLINGITGLENIKSGKIFMGDTDISKFSIKKRNEMKLAHIPQDRQKFGVVLDFNIGENAVLKKFYKKPFSKYGIINYKEFSKEGEKLISDHDIRTPHGVKSSLRSMSGGNQQKVIIGREIESNPDVLLAVQPTRGVDVGAIESIHDKLLEQREAQKAILLVSLELDEIMKLSDRIAVIHDGEIMGIIDAKNADEMEIGLMMAGKVNKGEVK